MMAEFRVKRCTDFLWSFSDANPILVILRQLNRLCALLEEIRNYNA